METVTLHLPIVGRLEWRAGLQPPDSHLPTTISELLSHYFSRSVPSCFSLYFCSFFCLFKSYTPFFPPLSLQKQPTAQFFHSVIVLKLSFLDKSLFSLFTCPCAQIVPTPPSCSFSLHAPPPNPPIRHCSPVQFVTDFSSAAARGGRREELRQVTVSAGQLSVKSQQ